MATTNGWKVFETESPKPAKGRWIQFWSRNIDGEAKKYWDLVGDGEQWIDVETGSLFSKESLSDHHGATWRELPWINISDQLPRAKEDGDIEVKSFQEMAWLRLRAIEGDVAWLSESEQRVVAAQLRHLQEGKWRKWYAAQSEDKPVTAVTHLMESPVVDVVEQWAREELAEALLESEPPRNKVIVITTKDRGSKERAVVEKDKVHLVERVPPESHGLDFIVEWRSIEDAVTESIPVGILSQPGAIVERATELPELPELTLDDAERTHSELHIELQEGVDKVNLNLVAASLADQGLTINSIRLERVR